MNTDAAVIKELAFRCGFELAGIARAAPSADFERFDEWRSQGFAGEMNYLTDHRGDLRRDPRNLLSSARSIVCVGKLYNTPETHSTEMTAADRGWISRYAWTRDYHDVLRDGLEKLVAEIAASHPEPFESRICVDAAPLLERSLASSAGLGWIGKNTCLINQSAGSWFFLGELLLSIELTPDTPVPHRCGTCTRCIDACPTTAILPNPDGTWSIDSRLCISYLTIEKRGEMSDESGVQIGNHLFGCDICQDVCPWNRRAPFTADASFSPSTVAPALEHLASLTEEEFRTMFRRSPIWRAKYSGFLRNVALAMGNSGSREMEIPLERLTRHPIQTVSSTAAFALAHLKNELQDRQSPLCTSAGCLPSS